MLAERQDGGTPWHAHHIAERHSLFAIIALGEGVVGTVAALSAVVDRQGWTLDAALVGIAGMGLTFGMWWVYYLVPSGEILQRHRDRASVWGYVQMLIVTSIVATGAGLHVAAYFIEGKAQISALATVLAVAVPVGVFLGLMYALYYYLVRRFDVFHVWLLIATAGVVPSPSSRLSPASTSPGASSSSCSRRRSRLSALNYESYLPDISRDRTATSTQQRGTMTTISKVDSPKPWIKVFTVDREIVTASELSQALTIAKFEPGIYDVVESFAPPT